MAKGPVPSQSTLSVSEQREAYFGQALAEHQYLQGSHIVDWLRSERAAVKPDSSWSLIRDFPEILETIRTREVELLRRCADSFVFAPGAVMNMSMALRSLLSSLDPYKATVYRADGSETVILNSHGQVLPSYVIREEKDSKLFHVKSLHASLVYDILLATWARNGSKAANARALLCDAVEAEIDRVRETAYQEFDQAVAVLPDGEGIMLADHVVLFEDDGSQDLSVRSFRSTVWRDAKLVLTDAYFDTETMYRGVPFNQFLHDLTSNGHTDAWNIALHLFDQGIDQAEVRTNDDKIIFFTHRRYATMSFLPRPDEILK